MFSINSQAEMYKWVDEQGNTHYTQSPPPDDIKAETIKPPSKVDTDGATKTLEQKKKKVDDLREKRITSAEEKQKAENDIREKEEKCNQAKERLASYQRPRVSLENPDGSLRVIPEEERQVEIKKSQGYVTEFCQ
ncbi:MAG: DUF4124 domain-containing protein [Pseudomonadota bacterium]